ncbi:hypothetical protein HanHA300_Chr10g0382871 [Helianthus annuus]|nr:hypothetical protein HanHA300_Chr10g0382871 [Helianthus annuus]KAJ0531832.1 hypothetical protein HanHA89_Chr10g0405271 [Helianthus annuus]
MKKASQAGGFLYFIKKKIKEITIILWYGRLRNSPSTFFFFFSPSLSRSRWMQQQQQQQEWDTRDPAVSIALTQPNIPLTIQEVRLRSNSVYVFHRKLVLMCQ